MPLESKRRGVQEPFIRHAEGMSWKHLSPGKRCDEIKRAWRPRARTVPGKSS